MCVHKQVEGERREAQKERKEAGKKHGQHTAYSLVALYLFVACTANVMRVNNEETRRGRDKQCSAFSHHAHYDYTAQCECRVPASSLVDFCRCPETEKFTFICKLFRFIRHIMRCVLATCASSIRRCSLGVLSLCLCQRS